jgi:protein disulfide-isomerase-like protein
MKFNIEKMISKKIKFLKGIFTPNNMPRLILLLIVLGGLYFIYDKYLEKEGFECESGDLDSEVNDGTKLVLFYADWCGHCKKIKPEWDKTAKKVNKDDTLMIKVNCGEGTDKDQEIMKKYKIEGYPTIIKFVNGKPQEYTGDRDESGFKGVFS